MRVRYVEGLAIHSGPESCAGAREGASEALTGVRTGQPLSRERSLLGADIVTKMESNTDGCVIASARTTWRGHRPWHVRMFLAREPGDLGLGRRGIVGPHREGEEP